VGNGYQIETEIEETNVTSSPKNSTQYNQSITSIWMARVTGTVTDKGSNHFKGASSLRGISFIFITNQDKSQDVRSSVSYNDESGGEAGFLALPLFPNFGNLPLKNELVFIIPNISGINMPISKYFYISTINYLNQIYNPDALKRDLDKNDDINLGNGIRESNLSKIRKLILAPGDNSLEGRFGNSIRLGNSNNLNVTKGKDPSPTPYEGKQNSPITIIRNGQKDVGKNLSPIFEDINNDNSSIYLTKEQIISIDVASKNLETFNIEVPEVTTSDNLFNFGELEPKEIIQADTPPTVISTPEVEEEPVEEPVEEQPIPEPDKVSDEVFITEKEAAEIMVDSTSDPVFTDPPPSPPPTIPEDADVYYLEDGTYITFEMQGPKKTAVATKDNIEVYRGMPSSAATKKVLAEEAALNLNSPLYGITEPPITAPTTPTDPTTPEGGTTYTVTEIAQYSTPDGIYTIEKDNVEYMAHTPGGSRFTGGYSIDSHDDNTAIELIKEEIDEEYED